MLSLLLTMVVLLALSAFFSGSETALFSLRREDLHLLGRRREHLVRTLLKDPRSLLITVLFGNLLVNILFYSTSVVLLVRLGRMGERGWATVVGVGAPLAVVILGEVAPKTMAVCRPRPLACLAAPVLLLLKNVILPVRLALGAFTEGLLRLIVPRTEVEPFVTADELKQLLQKSQARGTVRPEEGRMLRELVDLGHLRCREVMVPRVDMVACPVETPPEDFLDLVRRSGRKKIPVYQGDEDHILGVVDVRCILTRNPSSLRHCLQPIPFAPESKTVESLLREFRQTHTAMAIVVDEYGGTAGLITLHDILEELVGEIGLPPTGEPTTQEETIQQIAPNTYRVPARLSIRDWNEHPAFSVELARRNADTIGGFVVGLLGRMPRPGDAVTYRNLRFVVERVGKRRIETLRVELQPVPTTGERKPGEHP